MALTLSPELEQRVNEKIASGAFPSADEVIRISLNLLENYGAEYERRRAEVQKLLDESAAQMERGEYTVYSSAREMMDAVEARGREILAQRKAAAS